MELVNFFDQERMLFSGLPMIDNIRLRHGCHEPVWLWKKLCSNCPNIYVLSENGPTK